MVSCWSVCERRRYDGIFNFFFGRRGNLCGGTAVYGQYETVTGKDHGDSGMPGSGIERTASV